MILDGTAIPAATTLDADVAVVGAGPVGIVTALELAKRGHDVILVESGEREFRAPIQALSDTDELDPELHAPMAIAVRRQIGGTSTIWGGRCVPYDPVDFERRPLAHGAQWPVGYDELTPFFQRACDWFACGRAVFDADAAGLPPSIVPGLAGDEASTASLERWSLPTDFGKVYGGRLSRTTNVRVVTGLTCTRVAVAESDHHRVARLECKTLGRTPISIRARRYVLACGGLETTRLLLASRTAGGCPIGNHSDHLGRWYMGHLEGVIADVQFATPPQQTIYDYERDDDGVYVRRRFTIARRTQCELELPNIVAWLANPALADAGHRSGPLSFVYLTLRSPAGPHFAPDAQRSSLTGTKVPGSPYAPTDRSPLRRHLLNIARQPIHTVGFLASFGRRRFAIRDRPAPGFFVFSPDNRYPFQYHGEHRPHRNSRVTLSDRCDAIGMPKLRIDLHFSDDDIDDVVRAHDVWDHYLRRSGVGRLEYLQDDHAEAVLDRAGAGFHQIGTTRMSDRPSDGVVDKNLAVHGFPDLHVAGSSVFVTSGQANSTFMAVVLALRLVDHLHRDLSGCAPVRS